MLGKIHSTISFGTVDGPGVRYVIFFQGCPLRCAYCHNPDTWNFSLGEEKTVDQLVSDALKYKHYFKQNGGVTLSGGEPLAQLDFAISLLKAFKEKNIHTCVDTSGITFTSNNYEKFLELIKYVDLFLLDIKHIDNKKALNLTKQENTNTLSFARFLSLNFKDMWIRYVLIPNITSDEIDLLNLKDFIDSLGNVKKVEILPYHKMGIKKYKELNLKYELEDVETPSEDLLKRAKDILVGSV